MLQGGCPLGFFCANATTKERCRKVKRRVSGRLTTQATYCDERSDKAALCPAGYYCSRGDSKVKCGQGYHCPEGTYKAKQCAPGRFSQEPNQACKDCPKGYYQPSNTAVACMECKKGTFCAAGGDEPLPCEASGRLSTFRRRVYFGSPLPSCDITHDIF